MLILFQKNAANAIGGLSVGEYLKKCTQWHTRCVILPKDKPRYLMGVGTPANLLENIAIGVDMFDCVLPTRNAKRDIYLRWYYKYQNEKWKSDFTLLDNSNYSFVDTDYTKAF